MSRYIDPLTDFSFKKIFGSEPNKGLLISFLNGVFQGRKTIVDLVYNKNEHVGDGEDNGSVIFDLTCTGQDGAQFLIEVQRTDQAYLKKRMLYYAGKLIADQAPKGRRAAWRYDISEVYVIVLMDGFTMPDGSDGNYLHDICLCDRKTGKVFYENLGFIYLELANFVKEEAFLGNDLDKWLYVLKHMSKMDRLPVYLRKPIFEQLFDIAEYNKLNKEERKMYDVSLKRRWDEYNIRETAREKGYEEGMEKGMEEGMEKGIEKGKVEGRKEGKKEVVRSLILKTDFSDEKIMELTSVTLDFVKKIRAELKKEK